MMGLPAFDALDVCVGRVRLANKTWMAPTRRQYAKGRFGNVRSIINA